MGNRGDATAHTDLDELPLPDPATGRILLALALAAVGVLGLVLACEPGARLAPALAIAGLALLAAILLAVIGFGCATLLPRRLRPSIGFLRYPLLGLALLMVLVHVPQTYWCGSRLPIVLVCGLGLAGTLVAAGQKLRPARRAAVGQVGATLGPAALPLLLAAAAALFSAVMAIGLASPLPLLGENSDWVLYTTLARLWPLVDAEALATDAAYGNLIEPGQYGPSVGASASVHFLSTLHLVTGLDPLRIFVPALVALRGLSVLALWELCRAGFGWGRRRAAAACALLAVAHGHTTLIYLGFANQTAALVLLPMAMLSWIELVDEPSLPRAFAAALWMNALLDDYVALMPHFAVAAFLLLAGRLLRGTRRLATAGWALAAGLTAAALSPTVHRLVGQLSDNIRFWSRGGSYQATWGDASQGFVPPPGWVGIRAELEGIGPWLHAAWPVLAMAIAVLVLACVLVLLLDLRREGRWRAVVLSLVVMLLALRALPFSYGFNKTILSLTFVIDLAFVGGLATVAERIRAATGRRARRSRTAVVVLSAVAYLTYFVALATSSTIESLSLARNRWRPLGWRAADIARLLSGLPAGTSVAAPGCAGAPRLTTLIGYFLAPDSHPTGPCSTYYFNFYRPSTGTEEYLLVEGSRPPEAAGHDLERTAGRFRLLRRNRDLVLVHREDEAVVIGTDGASFPLDPAEQPPARGGGGGPVQPARYDVAGHFLATAPALVRMTVGERTESFELEPGVGSIRVLRSVPLPGCLTLEPVGSPPILLNRIEVWRAETARAPASEPLDVLHVRSRSSLERETVRAEATTACPDLQDPPGALLVVAGDEGQAYGWWFLSDALDEGGIIRVDLEIPTRRARVTVAGAVRRGGKVPHPGDGTYTASLVFSRRGQVLAAEPLFRFTLKGHAVTGFRSAGGDRDVILDPAWP